MSFKIGGTAQAIQSFSGITGGKTYPVLYLDRAGDPVLKNDNGEVKRYYAYEFTKTKGKVMDTLKEYFNSHKDTFITLGLVILLDEYLLGGGLRERIVKLCNSLLTNAEKKLKGN